MRVTVRVGHAALMFTFRRLSRDDFGLLAGWLAQPHVGQWWGFRVVARGELEPDSPRHEPMHEILRIDRPGAPPTASGS